MNLLSCDVIKPCVMSRLKLSAFRKNPVHRKQFRHPERPAPRPAATRPPNDDPDDDPDDDSFISDDSGDDSDYEPQDDLQRQREAKAFQRRRR
ncbi:aprataxin and PNK-like factor [Poecilia latipinna]|uniref:aprataxin and PNK-like factor n=1 Tax=Poecilia latipinna TaxID=48699 RepID=UPI00072E0323|nr:PREDICTED: aprataxin and PNK-like factor [Poecilia latipinna]